MGLIEEVFEYDRIKARKEIKAYRMFMRRRRVRLALSRAGGD